MATTSCIWRGTRRWMLVAAAAISTGASAQQLAIGANPCLALTTLAPDAAAPAPVIGAGPFSPPFRSPRPTLKAGADANWNGVITITFAPIDARLAKCLEGDLTLFLDHHPLAGLAPIERTGNEGEEAIIRYRLTRPATSSPGWNEVMAKAWESGGTYEVTVGVGTGGNEFAYAENKLRLTLGSGSSSDAVLALLASVASLAIMWRWSKLLQDRQTGPMSYSLSRLLLSCWVLTTISAVGLMFLRTGAMPSASEGGLVFMLGISGATTGLSSLIDLIRKPKSTGPTRFWQDFMDDADGLALHRIQVALFNCMVLFIVWRDMIQLGTVAQIDKAWVALLGASAITFVFGKSGEST